MQVEEVLAELLIHIQPGSTRQLLDHPSKSKTPPSSHSSLYVINPSPHCCEQLSLEVGLPPEQCQPFTSPEQSPLHFE